MPAIITLSRMSFHSSGVKFDLSVISFSSTLSSPPEPCQPVIKARMLMMRKFRERAEEAPWQLISSSSSRSAPMCGTTASGRTRNDGRCTGGHNSVQYVLSYGHI